MKQPVLHSIDLTIPIHGVCSSPRRPAPLLLALAGCAALGLARAQPVTGGKPIVPPHPFFAFDNGLNDDAHQTLAAKADLLKELGYDGVGWRPGQVTAMRAKLEQRGLKMFTIYTGAKIGADEQKYDPRLPEIIEQLEGSATMIWLTVGSRQDKSSSPTGDARATTVIREIAALADQAGLKVALYPHYGMWVQTTEDAVRVVKKISRPNVGVTFNLCHCLRAGNGPRIPDILRVARPYLFLVSINGADKEGKDWRALIQTLDRGTFDQRQLLNELRAIGYTGPIGLQCYNIPGNARENLARSIRAWNRLSNLQAVTPASVRELRLPSAAAPAEPPGR